MSDIAVIGAGTVISVSLDNATYVPIANLIDLKLPKFSVGKVPTEHSKSTATASVTLPGATSTTSFTVPVKTFAPGWIEPSESEFKVQLLKTQHAQLKGLQFSRTVCWWKISLPPDISPVTTLSTEVWQGFVMDIDADVATLENKLIEATIKIQNTTVDTFTAGT